MSRLVSLPMQTATHRPWWNRPHVAAAIDCLLIFAVALALRLYGLGTKPLWIDEVVTRLRASLPHRDLIADSFGHHHLPTYFLLLSQLSPGANVWLLRLPSAVGGAVAAALGVLVGRKLAEAVGVSRSAGLIVGLMLAAAPVMVQFSQDARPYPLELACLMLSLWGLVTLAIDGEAAGGYWRKGIAAWLALLLGMIGALALIGNALPFVLVANLSAWPIARRLAGGQRRSFVLRWIGGQMIILLTVGPLYLAMTHGTDDGAMAAFNWIPPLSALRAWRVAANVYLLRGADIASLRLVAAGLPVLGLAVPLLAVAGCIALRRQRAALIAMLLAVLLLPVLLVVSEPARPLWLPRYLLWSGAAALILAGTGAAWLARQRPLSSCALAAALLLINLLPFYRAETTPRWDLAAVELAPALAEGAALYMDDHAIPMMLRAYLPGGDAALPKSRVLYKVEAAQARLNDGFPIVAVHGPVGQESISTMPAFQAQLQTLGAPAERVRIGQDIVLLRFTAAPANQTPRVEINVQGNP